MGPLAKILSSHPALDFFLLEHGLKSSWSGSNHSFRGGTPWRWRYQAVTPDDIVQ